MGPREDELPGSWLRGLREAAGLTQEELAGRSGLSERAIGNMERGIGRPYPRSIRLIATALGLSSAASEGLVIGYRTMGNASQVRPDRAPAAAWPGRGAGPAAGLHQLPAAIPYFAGRTAELALLDRWLEQANGAAIAISAINGMAGVGKTTLGAALGAPDRPASSLTASCTRTCVAMTRPGSPPSPSEVVAGFCTRLA